MAQIKSEFKKFQTLLKKLLTVKPSEVVQKKDSQNKKPKQVH